ncbi:hypothetical protein QT995_01625 [Microcoleus sp. S36b_A3]|uniref:hypothetical protein n=1 Tax=unclassified Microcoleus TaxID=2642155 RepID=UPI002FCF94B8
MRHIRLFALGIVSFIAVLMGALLAPGTFVNRALSAALCTVFSFNSTICTVNLVNSSDRVVAATPPAVERNIANWLVQRAPGEFDDAPSVPSGSNPQVPPFPQDPGPNQPLRPDFDNPSIPQPNQAQSRNYDFTGLWAFIIYASPSNSKPFSLNFIQVNDNGNEYVSSLCQKDCNSNQFRASSATHVPQEKSLTTDYENLNFEILPSTDNQAMWGKILNKTTGESIYFTMVKLIKIAAKSNEKQQFMQGINESRLQLVNASNRKNQTSIGRKPIKIYSLSSKTVSNLLVSINRIYQTITKFFSNLKTKDMKILVEGNPKPGESANILLNDIYDQTPAEQRQENQGPSNQKTRPSGGNTPSNGNNQGGKNSQGHNTNQQTQEQTSQSNNRLLNDVGNSENTLEQGSGWIKDINKNGPKWFAAFFAPILGSLFGTISNSKADAAENTQTPSPQQTAQKPETQNSQQPQDDCNANSNQGDKPKNWSLDLPCFMMKNGQAQSNGYCRERTNVTEQGNSISGQIPLTVNGARMQWSLSGSLSRMVASPTGNECAITFENISRVTNGNKLVAINGTAKTCGVSGSFHMRNLNPDDARSKQSCTPEPPISQPSQEDGIPMIIGP